jgi:hypothetical protein
MDIWVKLISWNPLKDDFYAAGQESFWSGAL